MAVETPAFEEVAQGVALAEDFKARFPARIDDYTIVKLSPAQVQALFSGGGQILVPAPGAGKIVIPLFFYVFYDFIAAAYAGIAAGEDLSFSYATGLTPELGQLETTGFLDQASDQFRVVYPHTQLAGNTGLAPKVNDAIKVSLLTGDITTGDGPVTIQTFYKVVNAAPNA